jgi:hypothetical protein
MIAVAGSAQLLSAGLLGANPGPAAHLALLGGIVVAALVIFGIARWRRRRDPEERDQENFGPRP